MHVDTVSELRNRVAHARQLADQMSNHDARLELRQIADALEAEAERLANGEPDPLPSAPAE